MSKILSQEEIDALLSSAAEIERQARPSGGHASREPVITYNFRRPDRVSKDQIRSLHFLHDRFARNVTTSLSAYLRTVTDVNISSVEQFTYSEFLMSLPDPTAFYAFSIAPLEGMGALELNPNVAFTMIDRMLGGSGKGMSINRALTEIEQNVIDGVVKIVMDNLNETWKGITEPNFRITARETRPQMLQVAAPNEVVVLLGFDVKVSDARGMLNICLPASAIESVGASFTRTWHRAQRAASEADRRYLFDNIGRMPLPLEARLHTTIATRELIELRVGDVITFPHPVHEPVGLYLRDLRKGLAQPVRTASGAALRVVECSIMPAPAEP